MDAWKPKLTVKEKICATLWKVAGYLACIALTEAMMIMFVLLA